MTQPAFSPKSILLSLLALLSISGGSIIAFNWLIDPYAFFNSPQWQGLNQEKTRFKNAEALSKLIALNRSRAEHVVLGNSREAFGIPMSHPLLEGKTRYNMAFNGASISEIDAVATYVFQKTPAKNVLLGLDFFIFNAYYSQNQPGNLRLQLLTNMTRATESGELHKHTLLPIALLSTQAIKDSWKTIKEQASGIRYPGSHGEWAGNNMHYPKKKAGKIYREIEAQFLPHYWMPQPKYRYAFEIDNITPFQAYQHILEEAHQNDVRLTLVIGPMHARTLTLMELSGMWGTFSEWKVRLVDINENTAKQYGKKPFALLDFSWLQAASTEAVPNMTSTTPMQGFFDANHYTPTLGSQVVTAWMTGNTDSNIKLNKSTIINALHKQRENIKRFAINHPQDYQELQYLWDEFYTNHKAAIDNRLKPH